MAFKRLTKTASSQGRRGGHIGVTVTVSKSAASHSVLTMLLVLESGTAPKLELHKSKKLHAVPVEVWLGWSSKWTCVTHYLTRTNFSQLAEGAPHEGCKTQDMFVPFNLSSKMLLDSSGEHLCLLSSH
eukprot:2478481-Amphidinium_carterae.1